MNPWQNYQPLRAREKEIYDIMLRDGTVVLGCYPNGVHWNAIFQQIFGPPPRAAGRGPWADYRVISIRRSQPDPFKDEVEEIETKSIDEQGKSRQAQSPSAGDAKL